MEKNLGLWDCRIEVMSTLTPTETTSMTIVGFYYVHYDAAGNDHYNLNVEYVVIA